MKPNEGRHEQAPLGGVSSSPHEWDELKPTLRERLFGHVPRCRACYAPQDAHPAPGWNKSRPLGDRQPPFVRAWLDV